MFGDRVLVPDNNRAAVYDSEASDTRRQFGFPCACCPSEILLDLPSYIGKYQDREEVLGPSEAEAIRLHCGLRQDKSLIDGWPRFRVESCCSCGTQYLVYVAVHEPANGWFKVVPQGISRLPSNNSSRDFPSTPGE